MADDREERKKPDLSSLFGGPSSRKPVAPPPSTANDEGAADGPGARKTPDFSSLFGEAPPAGPNAPARPKAPPAGTSALPPAGGERAKPDLTSLFGEAAPARSKDRGPATGDGKAAERRSPEARAHSGEAPSSRSRRPGAPVARPPLDTPLPGPDEAAAARLSGVDRVRANLAADGEVAVPWVARSMTARFLDATKIGFMFLTLLFFCSTPSIIFGGARGDNNGAFGESTSSGALFPLIAGAIYLGSVLGILTKLRGNIATLIAAFPVWAVAGFATASALWSIHPDVSLAKGATLFGTTFGAVYVALAASPRQQIALLVWALAPLMIGSLAMAVVMPGSAFDPGGGFLLHGLFAQKNALGWVAAMSAIASLGAALERLVPRLIGLAAFGVSLLAIVASHSAAGLIAASVGAMIYLALYVMRSGGSYWWLILIALAVSSIPMIFALDQLTQMVFASLGKSETLTGRTLIWAALVPAIQAKPLLGWGYAAFWIDPISNMYMSRGAFWVGNAQGGYHDMLVTLGWVGLGVFASAYVYILTRLIPMAGRGDRVAGVYVAMLGALIIMGWTAPVFLGANMIYWPLVALGGLHVAKRPRQA